MGKLTWKFSFGHLNCPTPKAIARFGSAMWAMSTTVAVPAFLADKQWVGVAIFAMGAVGKFLCEFFTIEPDDNQAHS